MRDRLAEEVHALEVARRVVVRVEVRAADDPAGALEGVAAHDRMNPASGNCAYEVA